MFKKDKCVVFDLDDTLFKEEEYVFSYYRYKLTELGIYNEDLYLTMKNRFRKKLDVFDWFIDLARERYSLVLTINDVLLEYRKHFPDISMNSLDLEALYLIKNKEFYLGVITDGRSITQRNKMEALGILNLFDCIVISQEFGSEKPCDNNYLYVAEKLPASEYMYVADNVDKDFIAPYALGWRTFCVRNNGYNIHQQDLNKLGSSTIVIDGINELKNYF